MHIPPPIVRYLLIEVPNAQFFFLAVVDKGYGRRKEYKQYH